MGFFSNMYTKEGPGVPKDAPPKKGILRYFEIVFRDMGMIWSLGALTFLCFVPAIISAVLFAVFTPYILLMVLFAVLYILSSMLVGPALCSMQAVLVSRVRDIPCFMMHEYKKAWKANWRQSVPAGCLAMLLVGLEIFTGYQILNSTDEMSYILLGIVLLSLVLIIATFQMVFLQILFIDLPLGKMLKNGLLMSIGYLKNTLPAALIIIILYGAMVVFYIFWPFYALLGLIGFITVIIDMITWPAMEKAFKVTELQEQRKLEQEKAEFEELDKTESDEKE